MFDVWIEILNVLKSSLYSSVIRRMSIELETEYWGNIEIRDRNRNNTNKDENLVVANRIVFNALKIFIKSLIRIFLSLRHDTMNLL